MKDKYWVNQSGILTVRDLRAESNNWDREKFLKREGLDLYNYMWEENFSFFDYSAIGCMYEVGGLRVDRGDTVVDIGANIGMWSMRAAEQGAAEVICFEPVRLNYVCLCLNSTPSPCPVKPYNYAIGDRMERITMRLQDNMGFCDNKSLPDRPEEDAVVVTLDWLFDLGILKKIDFLKIDVEGVEDRIIFNISKERLAKINKIAMEYHYNCPVESEVIIKYLYQYGLFLRFRMDLGDNMKIITFSR